MLALSAMSVMQAQEGGITFTDFEPDLCVSALTDNFVSDTINVDFDADGTSDLKMFIVFESSAYGKVVNYVSSWKSRFMSENDTVVPSENWINANYLMHFLFETGIMFREETLGFRKEVDGHYYYAWARVYTRRESIPVGYPKVWGYCDKFAYCDIPDYPLRWGQTDILGVEENSGESFATIYPNPVSGNVNVKVPSGAEIESVSLFDISGRLVKAQQSGFGSIDISGLATGMYVMKVALDDGKVFEEKIVKK